MTNLKAFITYGMAIVITTAKRLCFIFEVHKSEKPWNFVKKRLHKLKLQNDNCQIIASQTKVESNQQVEFLGKLRNHK